MAVFVKFVCKVVRAVNGVCNSTYTHCNMSYRSFGSDHLPESKSSRILLHFQKLHHHIEQPMIYNQLEFYVIW